MDSKVSVKQFILNYIDDQPRGCAKQLAEIAGYDSGSSFVKMLKKENSEFPKFQGILDVIKYIDSNKVESLMIEYSREVDPNKMTARCMLEYLCSNRLLNALGDLLNRMKECNNQESKEWAKVYDVFYNSQLNYPNVKFNDVIRQIRKIRTGVHELNVFMNLVTIYMYHANGKYTVTKDIAEDIKEDIEFIENDYIKYMYQARLGESMATVHLRIYNNPSAAREFADFVIESQIGLSFKAYAYFVKGYSYIFTSYETAKLELQKSLELYQSINRQVAIEDLEEKLEFIDVLWSKGNLKLTKNIKNTLLHNVKQGVCKAELVEENKEYLNESEYLYLKGCVLKDTEVLLESLVSFLNNGDRFLANLPKIELEKMGYNNQLLNRLISLRVA